MPELPEVETVKRGLEELIVGKTVASYSFDWPKSFPNAKNEADTMLVGATITGVRRRAKVLMVDLNNQFSLVVHLKMTGQMVFRGTDQSFGAGHPNESLIGELPDRSTRVSLVFSDASTLFFNDQR
jgi:formamidopyrimidine-DNA glycosylase